ncbi:MAG: cytidylate kinase family protein [Bacteroidaceae bacterium]|nr:cytidylate kinase family protein [Bacteroidaceae bacterium]
MFKVESELLRGIAETESCVIAGRSAFFILQQHPNHLSILIQASAEYRVERVTRKQNMTKEEARSSG